MKKLRFVDSKEHQNIGFHEEIINRLEQEMKIKFPKTYIEFLKRAGRRSNSLYTNYEDIDVLIKLQNTFREKLRNSDMKKEGENLWCFTVEFLNDYYFFELDNNENPMVYCFSDGIFRDHSGWNSVNGNIGRKTDFIEFIKWKTDDRWGYSILNRIKGTIVLILCLPVLIPFFIYTEIIKRR